MRNDLPRLVVGALVFAIFAGAIDRAEAFVPPNVSVARTGDMIYVGATKFSFGKDAAWAGPMPGTSTEGGAADGFVVSVDAFLIDRTEVTVAEYAACVKTQACPEPLKGDDANDCNWERPGFDDHPVNCVSWEESEKFCAWRGKRLPTEFEWELAERGPTPRPFPWGNDLPTPKHVNACDASCVREELKRGSNYTSLWADTNGDDGWPFTAPVGSFPAGASSYGVLDMSGNVEEWVSDLWISPPSPTPPAQVAGSYEDHVVRGGSWDLGTMDCFTGTRRSQAARDTRAGWLGFRCARTP